jgi:hypothetical protein
LYKKDSSLEDLYFFKKNRGIRFIKPFVLFLYYLCIISNWLHFEKQSMPGSSFYVTESKGGARGHPHEQTRTFMIFFEGLCFVFCFFCKQFFLMILKGDVKSMCKFSNRIFKFPFEELDAFAPENGRRVDLTKVRIQSLKIKHHHNTFPTPVCIHFEGLRTEAPVVIPPCCSTDGGEMLEKGIACKQNKKHWEPCPFQNCVRSGSSFSFSCHNNSDTLETLELAQLFNFHEFMVILERLDGKDWLETPLRVPKNLVYSPNYKGEVVLEIEMTYKYLHYYS